MNESKNEIKVGDLFKYEVDGYRDLGIVLCCMGEELNFFKRKRYTVLVKGKIERMFVVYPHEIVAKTNEG